MIMNQKEFAQLLTQKLGISQTFAESAAGKLYGCRDSRYLEAVENYANTGNMRFLEKDQFTTRRIMQSMEMDYLNAVLMLVWLETNPEEAAFALNSGYDLIV